MGDKIEVLSCTNGDKGFVRLVDHMGTDLSVVRSARVSYNADWRSGEDTGSDAKLIRYLLKNKHTSPFESVTATFEIKAPIFVFRQWHRHRTQSINEVSARYTKLDEGWYVPDVENITTQSTNNKQARTSEQHSEAESIHNIIANACSAQQATYEQLLGLNCPRELARGVLTVNHYSRMFTTANLHNWFHFIQLRSHSHAQYEIRVYSEALLTLLERFVPVSVKAFSELTTSTN